MKHELLAPAGNIEAGYAALYYGADAVYLGFTKFSARAGAENFSAEELDEFTAYAHSLGRKVFVALNTVLSEAEINELPEVFAILRQAKVDALIVQDLGVAYLAKRLLPEVELHASTQMAVHNAEGAQFLQAHGFKRVVLARELSLAEIKAIAEATPGLDLEVFVHGALCYSYSGQCLFSALEYGKSANRGRCVYPCRGVFEKLDANGDKKSNAQCVGEALRSHLFSMKDLALEEAVLNIPALSLKIEGRKKSPLYVAAVTNYYRHILDGKKKDLNEAEDIKQIFSRPWCRFHFNGKDKSVTDVNFVGHRGLVIGKVERVSKGRLIFKAAHNVARYDGIQIDAKGDEKPFGFGIKAMFVNNKPVFEAKAGETVELELPNERPHLEAGAPVYLASSSAVKGKYDYAKPKVGSYRNLKKIDVIVEIGKGKVWAMSGEAAVAVVGDFDEAKDVARVEEAVRVAFAKTGGTAFAVDMVEVRNPQKLFVPVSLLNDLRRQLLAKLEELSVDENGDLILPDLGRGVAKANVSTAEKLKLYYAGLSTRAEDVSEIENVWIVLPQICRNVAKLAVVVEELYNAGARHFVAENYYAFKLLAKYKDVEIGAGSFIYVMNRYATAELKEMGAVWATLALESSPDNMRETVKNAMLPMAQVIKAYPPLFTSAVCIRPNACKDCRGGVRHYQLKKDGREYVAVSKDCQIQLFNKEAYVREEVQGVAFVCEED